MNIKPNFSLTRIARIIIQSTSTTSTTSTTQLANQRCELTNTQDGNTNHSVKWRAKWVALKRDTSSLFNAKSVELRGDAALAWTGQGISWVDEPVCHDVILRPEVQAGKGQEQREAPAWSLYFQPLSQ